MTQVKIPIVIDGEEGVLRAPIERVLAQYGCLERCDLLFAAENSLQDAGARVFRPVFRVGELLDHVNRALKMGQQGAESVPIGPYMLDFTQGVLSVSAGGAEIRLTDKECELLQILYVAGGEMVERDVLLAQIWGYVPGVETHTVETHIYRLRQKIERDPANPEIILTDASGYRLASMVSP